MTQIICCIPADIYGNTLWIKDLRMTPNRIFVKYRSTYNDMKFMETEIIIIDNGQNAAITGTDGTVLFRFSTTWLQKLMMVDTAEELINNLAEKPL